MAAWLAGFKKTSDDDAAPQPFELVCECSVRHTGLRRKVHQRLVCRTCGTALFVLPRDPYPAPVGRPKAKKERRKRSAGLEEVGLDDLELGADELPSAKSGSSGRRVSRHRRKRENREEPAEKAAAASVAAATSAAFGSVAGAAGRGSRRAVEGVSRATTDAARGFREFWTPLKLTALGITLLASAAIWWTMHARGIERAESALNPAIEAGLAALEEGELDTANEQLSIAVTSLDTLGRHDRTAESWRQTHREVRALTGLASNSLLEMLEQAEASALEARVQRQSRPAPPEDEQEELPPPLDAAWQTKFEAVHRHGWLVLEAPVQRLSATAEEPLRFEVLFPIGVGPEQRRVEVRADYVGFEELGVGEEPRTVVFGGRLETCRLSDNEDRWEVTFDPLQGFLWTSAATYQRLGFTWSDWHPEEAVRAMLSEQARAVGVDPFEPKQRSADDARPNLEAGA
ncbi:MAG: hypothetical protein R3B90_08595 [Planctomycetaceae bacterium]